MKQFLIFFFLFLFVTGANCNEIKIILKIDKNIITNQDVLEEIKYISLNKNLDSIDKENLYNFAKNSIIREKIKKDEIEKYYNIDYEKEINSTRLQSILNDFISKSGYTDQLEFENLVKEKKLNINFLKKKFVIENYWNQLIYDKYFKQININAELIENKLENIKEQNSGILNYNLSEIVFFENNKEQNNLKYEEILNSIDNIGFEKTAILFSISESASNGGIIGWINEKQVSEIILNKIKNLKIGQYSQIIETGSGNIILYINDIKIIDEEIDIEKEKEKLIIFEKNRILNQYSILYYKQIENRSYVEKF